MQLRRNKEMEFKTLKKSHKKQIIIGALLVCVIGITLTVNLTRAKYRLTQDIPLAKGTVNYNPDKTAPIISNVQTSVTKTEINVTVNASDNVGVTEYWYQIGSNIAVKGIGNTYTFTSLTAGTTYTIKVYVKDAAGNQSATIVKDVITTALPASEAILTNIIPKITTPDFSNVAATDEGVYRVSDEMYGGYSYYWRGAVTNNYVQFAEFCWRIIRINGDGSIRLIYDGTTCHANGVNHYTGSVMTYKYNSSRDRGEYVGWTYDLGLQRTLSGTSSNLKTYTDDWYSTNITGDDMAKVVDGKFCNERSMWIGSYWNSSPKSDIFFLGYGRSGFKYQANAAPTLSCTPSDIYMLKAGAITMDEVMMAGATAGSTNDSFYLYSGWETWTMTPIAIGYNGSVYSYVVSLSSSGRMSTTTVTTSCVLRPVINLRSDTTFSDGNGTLEDPYVVQ